MSRKTGLPASTSTFVLLLLSLFASELIVLELFSPLLSHLPRSTANLTDAVLLALFFSLPLWLFFNRSPFAGVQTPADSPPFSIDVFCRSLASILLLHFLAMSVFPGLRPGDRVIAHSAADAGLALLLSVAPLWWFIARNVRGKKRISLTELLATPLGLYVLLLFIIFFVDLLQRLFLPRFFPSSASVSFTMVNSFITTLFVSPLLWSFVAGPLRAAARSERARVVAIRDQLVDAVVTTDAQLRIKSVNRAAERIFDYRAADVLDEELQRLLPVGLARLEKLLREATVSGVGRPPVHELPGCRRDGTDLVLEVSVSLVLQDGEPEYLLIMRDISSRKEMEAALWETQQRFRQIFEQTEDAIIFFKPGSCSVIDVNATAETLFGYTREEMKKVSLSDLTTPAELPRLTSSLRSMQPGVLSHLDEFTGRRKDGSELSVSMRGKIMMLQGVEIVYCTFRDITERIRLERDSLEIQAKLIQANKMTSLGLMVSGVAHEINNPNNFIMANARLLQKTWDDALKVLHEYQRENGDFHLGGVPFSTMAEHAPQLFAGIVDGSRRIEAIVKNLKGFARQDRVVEGMVDINKVAASAVSILHHELVRHSENFHLQLAEIPRVRGNKQQLGQVIINLLMNACQSLPSRSCGIWLTTGLDENNQVLISVRDEGCGISRQEGLRILEPFFTTKLDNGGTGLGLSICHSIVKEHQGTLEFDSESGKGTVFTVRIPALPAAGEIKEQCA